MGRKKGTFGKENDDEMIKKSNGNRRKNGGKERTQ